MRNVGTDYSCLNCCIISTFYQSFLRLFLISMWTYTYAVYKPRARSIGRNWLLWIRIEQAEQLEQLVLNRTATVPVDSVCLTCRLYCTVHTWQDSPDHDPVDRDLDPTNRTHQPGSRAAKYGQTNVALVLFWLLNDRRFNFWFLLFFYFKVLLSFLCGVQGWIVHTT